MPRTRRPGRWESGFWQPCSRHLSSQHTVQRIRSVIYDRFVEVWKGIEVLESQVAAIGDFVEGFQDSGPVGGAVEEEAEGVQVELVDFFGVLLEVDVLDSLAEDWNPVLGEVVLH